MVRAVQVMLLLCAPAIAQAPQYFPDGSLEKTPQDHSRQSGRYSYYLTAMREPSLWELSRTDPKAEAYRFTWLRTFHRPIAVRLTVGADRSVTLVTKILSGAGGYEAGKLATNRTKRLKKEQADWLIDYRLKELDLWEQLSTFQTRPPDVVSLDGAQWIVELVKDGRYHVIDRSSPASNDPVHAFSMLLADDLADLRLLYRDVY